MKNIIISILLFLIFSLSSYIYISTTYKEKILPNTYLGNENISNLDYPELHKLINDRYTLPNAIEIEYNNETQILFPNEIDLRYHGLSEITQKNGDLIEFQSLITNPLETIKTKENQVDIYYDKSKLINWFNSKFQINEEPYFNKPYIKANETTKEIEKCQTGKGSFSYPYSQLEQKLIINNKIQEKIKLDAEYQLLSSEESEINKLCNQITTFKENIVMLGAHKFIDDSVISKIFSFELLNDSLKIEIKDKKGLENQLTMVNPIYETVEVLPELRTIGNNKYFLGSFTPKKILDIDTTISFLETQLELSDFSGKIAPQFTYSSLPTQLNGNEITHFPKLVGMGDGKFSMFDGGWTLRESTRNTIIKGLQKINGMQIPPNTDFSLTEALDARIIDYSNPQYPTVTDGKISYGSGICGVATIVFRGALESGFPIIERHSHQQALKNYTYPYGGLVDASLYFRNELKEDFKFRNDSNSPILLVTDYTTYSDNTFHYKIRFYANNNFIDRDVELKNFVREDHVKGQGFKEEFTRSINGTDEVFKSQYYLSNF